MICRSHIISQCVLETFQSIMYTYLNLFVFNLDIKALFYIHFYISLWTLGYLTLEIQIKVLDVFMDVYEMFMMCLWISIVSQTHSAFRYVIAGARKRSNKQIYGAYDDKRECMSLCLYVFMSLCLYVFMYLSVQVFKCLCI